jgi:hypothetical protein
VVIGWPPSGSQELQGGSQVLPRGYKVAPKKLPAGSQVAPWRSQVVPQGYIHRYYYHYHYYYKMAVGEQIATCTPPACQQISKAEDYTSPKNVELVDLLLRVCLQVCAWVWLRTNRLRKRRRMHRLLRRRHTKAV